MSDYIVRWRSTPKGPPRRAPPLTTPDGRAETPDAIVGVYTVIDKETGTATRSTRLQR